ncbi:MAG: DNA-binding response regulator [Calditrichaeota bacterium]|nr:MAG: DNA-binding response regulator [Calditrichota bacterium]
MIDIIIVDDDLEFAENLGDLLNTFDEFHCEKIYGNCEAAIRELEEYLPDVILLDIKFPYGLSGLDAIQLMRQCLPDAKIIMLTLHDEDDNVFEALRKGASGYLLKRPGKDELYRAVMEVYQGGAPMSMGIAKKVVSYFQHENIMDNLTPREHQVLNLLCAGKSDKVIANELFISVNTVKFTNKKIYKKLHVHSRAEAISRALKHR